MLDEPTSGLDPQGNRDMKDLILNLQYDEDSYSWGLAQIVQKFVAGKKDISADDLKDWHDEFQRLSEAGRYFFGSNRYIFKASKPPFNA